MKRIILALLFLLPATSYAQVMGLTPLSTRTERKIATVGQTHATDCTTLACTASHDGEQCFEQDSDTLYVCNGSGTPAWKSIPAGGAGAGGSSSSLDYDGDGNNEVATDGTTVAFDPDDSDDTAPEYTWGETFSLSPRLPAPCWCFGDSDTTDEDDNCCICANCTDGTSLSEDCQMTLECQRAGTLTEIFNTQERVQLPISASLIQTDGAQCGAVAAHTINSGPKVPAFVCTDNAASIFDWSFPAMSDEWNAGTFIVELEAVNENATPSGVLDFDIACSCRGDSDTVNATYGTPQNASITFTTQYDVEHATTAEITCDGTCAVGDTVFFKATMDAASTTTASISDTYILGVKVGWLR